MLMRIKDGNVCPFFTREILFSNILINLKLIFNMMKLQCCIWTIDTSIFSLNALHVTIKWQRSLFFSDMLNVLILLKSTGLFFHCYFWEHFFFGAHSIGTLSFNLDGTSNTYQCCLVWLNSWVVTRFNWYLQPLTKSMCFISPWVYTTIYCYLAAPQPS